MAWSLSLVHIVCISFLYTVGHVSGIMSFTAFNPSMVNISVVTKNVTRLNSMVMCSENDTNFICVCLVTSISVPFETFWMQGDAGYFVYYDNTVRLPAGSTYNIDVECKSNNDWPPTKQTLKVQVIKNQPPVISNYKSDTVTIDASRTAQYAIIYNVTYTDPENDAVAFTMTQSPNLNHLIIGYGDGYVRTKIDMRSATVGSYTLTISASDPVNTVSGFVLTVNVNNRNHIPDFSNLPATVTVPETAIKDYVIFTLFPVDLDRYVPQEPYCVTTNLADMKKFTFDMPNGQIRVAYNNALDRETKITYTIMCSWSDGFLTSDPTEILTVNVDDINEAPVWSSTNYYCNINEGIAGGPSCSLRATCKDPENDRITVTVATTNNQNLFRYDLVIDRMTFTANYDVDVGGYDSDVTAIMTATDSKGMTSTATVKIYVNDINDNKCQTDPSLTFNLDETVGLKRLGGFTAADLDATYPNNDYYFIVPSSNPSTATHNIMVTRDGGIYYINLFPPDQASLTMQFTVHCIDGGSPRQTAATTLLVNYNVPTTTIETTTFLSTTTEQDIWKNVAFQATFGTLITLIGVGLVTLVGSIIACWRAKLNWRSWRFRQPVKQTPQDVMPYKPPTRRPLPPVEQGRTINPNWENLAWNQNDKNEGTL